MEEQRPQPYESFAHRHHHSAENIITLLDWLLVAFILALVFQGFAVQAFQIPTGSMAETLRGAHYQVRCFRCGHPFDAGSESLTVNQPQCPNCNYFQPPQAVRDLKNGDRIFVLKSIYQLFKPKRWDVVVFKNPTNPRDNYIKRLIGLPGETVQLIGGDVYIDGKIERKPINVQNEQWMPIFLQDQQPFSAQGHFDQLQQQGQDVHNKPLKPPFENSIGSQWQFEPGRYTLDDKAKKQHTLNYQTNNRDEFKATYAYNSSSTYSGRPICSDLMISFYTNSEYVDGYIGAALEKGGVLYSATVEFDGALIFSKTVGNITRELRRTLTGGIQKPGFQKFEFANVDHLLVLRWGDKRFTYDLTRDMSFEPVEDEKQPPRVQIYASGLLELRHIGLYRDIFYRGKEAYAIRATEDTPFTLNEDEFFVCGDNSNNSFDCRMWNVPGIGNNGRHYRPGTVPREFMMGKAVMVYWSQAFKPAKKLPPMIPNLGNIKVIYGGSEREY